MKQFFFSIILIFFLPILLLSQIKIEEKIEIEPVEKTIEKNFFSSQITSSLCTCRLEIEWDKPEREAFIAWHTSSPGNVIGDTFWKYGGTHSLEIRNFEFDASPTNTRFLVKVNLANHETTSIKYKLYVDETIIKESTFTLTGKWASIPYKKIEESNPLITSFDFTIADEQLCPLTTVDINLKNLCYSSGLLNMWNVNNEKLTLDIINGSEYVEFFNDEHKEHLGSSYNVLYKDFHQIRLYNKGNIEISSDELIIVKASVNGLESFDTTMIKPTTVNFYVDGFFLFDEVIHNQASQINIRTNIEGDCLDYKEFEEMDEAVIYTAEIIKGQEFGILWNESNEEKGQKLTVTNESIFSNSKLQFIANGDEVIAEEEVIIRLGSSLNEEYYKDISLKILLSNMLVEFLPKEITVNDTAEILLKYLDDLGQAVSFPENQQFYAYIIEGTSSGVLASKDCTIEDINLFGETEGFKYIANSNINTDSSTVILMVETFLGDNDLPTTITPIVSTQEQIRSLRKKTLNELKKSEEAITDINLDISSGQYLYGYAVLKIKKEISCEDFACDDKIIIIPEISVNESYPNGYNDYFGCDKASFNGTKPSGYFYPFLKTFDETFEPIEKSVCFDISDETWKNNFLKEISIRAILDICPNNLGSNRIQKKEEIDNIDKELLEDVLIQLRGTRSYPIKDFKTHESFNFTEIIWSHEYGHKAEFEDTFLKNALSYTYSFDNEIYSSFENAILSYKLSCSENNNYLEVSEILNEFLNELLNQLRDNIIIEKEKYYPSHGSYAESVRLESEKRMHKTNIKIQRLINEYETYISNLLKGNN